MEALFAELENQIGLRRLRLRRLRFVREQLFMAAAAQNLKRLVASSANRQHPPWKPPLSRGENKNSAAAIIAAQKDITITDFFNNHEIYRQSGSEASATSLHQHRVISCRLPEERIPKETDHE